MNLNSTRFYFRWDLEALETDDCFLSLRTADFFRFSPSLTGVLARVIRLTNQLGGLKEELTEAAWWRVFGCTFTSIA